MKYAPLTTRTELSPTNLELWKLNNAQTVSHKQPVILRTENEISFFGLFLFEDRQLYPSAVTILIIIILSPL